MLSKFVALFPLSLLGLGLLLLQPAEVGRASDGPTPTPQPASLDFAPSVGSLSDYFNRQPAQSPSVVSLAIRSASEPEQFLAEVGGFRALRTQAHVAPGWLHRLSRHMRLEDGQELRWQVEGWYEFDAAGNLAAAYERTLDADGKVLTPVKKVGIPEGSSILPLNLEPILPLGEDTAQPAPPLEPPVFDIGFYPFSQAALEAGWLFSNQILYENCWYMGETYNLSNGAIRVTALFYPDTGKLRTLQVYDLSGPSLKLIASLELPIEEHLSQPPAHLPTIHSWLNPL